MKIFKSVILLILTVIFSGGICFSAETLDLNLNHDYLMSTDSRINASTIRNQDVLTIDPFYTIENEKNALILHPVREGQTQFVIVLNSGRYPFIVNISSKLQTDTKTIIKKGPFEISAIDTPPMSENNFDIEPQGDKQTDIPVLRTQENTNVSPSSMDENNESDDSSAPVNTDPTLDKNYENYRLEAD